MKSIVLYVFKSEENELPLQAAYEDLLDSGFIPVATINKGTELFTECIERAEIPIDAEILHIVIGIFYSKITTA